MRSDGDRRSGNPVVGAIRPIEAALTTPQDRCPPHPRPGRSSARSSRASARCISSKSVASRNVRIGAPDPEDLRHPQPAEASRDPDCLCIGRVAVGRDLGLVEEALAQRHERDPLGEHQRDEQVVAAGQLADHDERAHRNVGEPAVERAHADQRERARVDARDRAAERPRRDRTRRRGGRPAPATDRSRPRFRRCRRSVRSRAASRRTENSRNSAPFSRPAASRRR